jgi:pyridoxine 5-phosphate synthase
LADAHPSLGEMVATLKDAGIHTTAFLDPDMKQIHEAARFRFDAVEMHTGAYANAPRLRRDAELKKLEESANAIRHLGMRVHAGHGLNYHTITALLEVPHLEEVNIGHSIVARAVMVGMDRAVRDMLHLLGRV